MDVARQTPGAVALAAVLAVSLCAAASASAYTLDPSFGSGGLTTVPKTKGFSGTGSEQAILRPGGGYLVAGSAEHGGYFDEYWMVTAFTADGRLDKRFGDRGRVMLAKNWGSRLLRYGSAKAIAVQPDGKILVGSTADLATRRDYREYHEATDDFTDTCNCTASRAAFAVIRLTRSGKIDRSYGKRGLSLIRSVVRSWGDGMMAELSALTVDARGRALVFGQSEDFNRSGNPVGLVFRLRSRGTLDKSFGVGGRIVERHPKDSGSVEPLAIGLDGHGAITTATRRTTYAEATGSVRSWLVRRYGSDGAPNRAFGFGGAALTTVGSAGALLTDAMFGADGSLMLAGTLYDNRNPGNSDDDFEAGAVVARFDPSGALDQSFGVGGFVRPPLPPGANSGFAAAMHVNADRSTELVETPFTLGEGGFPLPQSSQFGIRRISPDGSVGDFGPLPKLGDRYAFHVGSLFSEVGGLTLAGMRYSESGENRITLMRVRP